MHRVASGALLALRWSPPLGRQAPMSSPQGATPQCVKAADSGSLSPRQRGDQRPHSKRSRPRTPSVLSGHNKAPLKQQRGTPPPSLSHGSSLKL
ncbi:hypothetical protein DPEC_G00162930 [Dallia pectoralis]|uniref:Uncharacterized protein n=1 Tax=Dallia pectoralis TaxID=75939 RepID=A0ACC2GGH3_DALPE|nr:hypothetical protein DPEC_G00162930 [Dallia pectoralis]